MTIGMSRSVRGDARPPLLRVLRSPTSEKPDAGTVAFVDNGSSRGRGPRGCGARFNGTEWLRLSGAPLGFDPTYWNVIDEGMGK